MRCGAMGVLAHYFRLERQRAAESSSLVDVRGVCQHSSSAWLSPDPSVYLALPARPARYECEPWAGGWPGIVGPVLGSPASTLQRNSREGRLAEPETRKSSSMPGSVLFGMNQIPTVSVRSGCSRMMMVPAGSGLAGTSPSPALARMLRRILQRAAMSCWHPRQSPVVPGYCA